MIPKRFITSSTLCVFASFSIWIQPSATFAPSENSSASIKQHPAIKAPHKGVNNAKTKKKKKIFKTCYYVPILCLNDECAAPGKTITFRDTVTEPLGLITVGEFKQCAILGLIPEYKMKNIRKNAKSKVHLLGCVAGGVVTATLQKNKKLSVQTVINKRKFDCIPIHIPLK